MRRWMSSTSSAAMRPSATPRWLVTTTTCSPAARSEATAPTAPGRNSNSSHDSTYSPGGALTLITPSRSRKTVVRWSATRGDCALDDLAEHVGDEDVALLDARRRVGGDDNAVVAQRRHVAARAAGHPDRRHAHRARGVQRSVHIRGAPAGGDAEGDVLRRREPAQLPREDLVEAVVVGDGGHRRRVD